MAGSSAKLDWLSDEDAGSNAWNEGDERAASPQRPSHRASSAPATGKAHDDATPDYTSEADARGDGCDEATEADEEAIEMDEGSATEEEDAANPPNPHAISAESPSADDSTREAAQEASVAPMDGVDPEDAETEEDEEEDEEEVERLKDMVMRSAAETAEAGGQSLTQEALRAERGAERAAERAAERGAECGAAAPTLAGEQSDGDTTEEESCDGGVSSPTPHPFRPIPNATPRVPPILRESITEYYSPLPISHRHHLFLCS